MKPQRRLFSGLRYVLLDCGHATPIYKTRTSKVTENVTVARCKRCDDIKIVRYVEKY